MRPFSVLLLDTGTLKVHETRVSMSLLWKQEMKMSLVCKEPSVNIGNVSACTHTCTHLSFFLDPEILRFGNLTLKILWMSEGSTSPLQCKEKALLSWRIGLNCHWGKELCWHNCYISKFSYIWKLLRAVAYLFHELGLGCKHMHEVSLGKLF